MNILSIPRTAGVLTVVLHYDQLMNNDKIL
jgi:hypothetical protein